MSDELEQRLDAMSNWMDNQKERIKDLERENAELRRQVSELQAEVTPDPGSKEYDKLTRSEKVQRLREQLLEEAGTRHSGKASMKYREVMMLFDGNPSAGHCYDLMRRAGECDGFDYDENEQGDKRVQVDADAVNDDSLFHAVNNAAEA